MGAHAKILVTKTKEDPWTVVTARDWRKYQTDEIGSTLLKSVTGACSDGRHKAALTSALILEKWARFSSCWKSRSSAMLALVFTGLGLDNLAEVDLADAQQHAKACRECALLVYKVMAYAFKEGLLLLDARRVRGGEPDFSRSSARRRRSGRQWRSLGSPSTSFMKREGRICASTAR